MQKAYILFTLFILLGFNCIAQTINSPNNYITYQKGNLPFIISIPHGGNIVPSNMPDRTCNNPTTVTDIFTIELARAIDTAFMIQTGCRPHIIICNLKRTKLDCNRNLADGACGNADAALAWNYFHNYIDSAQATAKSQFNGKAFYIDLHGHGHTIQQLELGYLLTATELGYTNAVLNSSTYVNSSSLRNLVSTNVNAYTHTELLRGNFSLGTLLENAGFAAVPSLQNPSPGTNPYFDGGYNTAVHTSNTDGNNVNGVQIEANYTGVRDSYSNRKKFGDSLARVLAKYINIHQNVSVANCNAVLPVVEKAFSVSIKNCKPYFLLSLNQPFSLQKIVLEQSKNGVQFIPTKNIPFAASVASTQQISFTHSPEDKVLFYYRLKLIDADGSYQYSTNVLADVKCKAENTYHIYPNPVSHFLHLTNTSSAEKVITITNIYGQIIEKYHTKNGKINVAHLPNGYYLLCINQYVQLPFLKN